MIRTVSVAAGVVAAACTGAPAGPAVTVVDARAPAPPADVMGVYLTIQNRGAAPDVLLGGEIPGVGPLAVHETTTTNGVTSMRPVPQLAVPAESDVVLRPGAMHGMVTGITAPPAVGDTIMLILHFEVSGPLEVPLAVVTYADLES